MGTEHLITMCQQNVKPHLRTSGVMIWPSHTLGQWRNSAVTTVMIGGRILECSEKKLHSAAIWTVHIWHPTVTLQSCPRGVMVSDSFSALLSHPTLSSSGFVAHVCLNYWRLVCFIVVSPSTFWWSGGVRCMAGWLSLPLTIGIKRTLNVFVIVIEAQPSLFPFPCLLGVSILISHICNFNLGSYLHRMLKLFMCFQACIALLSSGWRVTFCSS